VWLYSNSDGNPAWSSTRVAGPGVVTGSPALVSPSTGTEIAAIT
jgi:hypothetical protein